MQRRRTPSRSCETCKLRDVKRWIRKWSGTYRRTRRPPIPHLYRWLQEEFGYDLSLSALRDHIRNCLGIRR